MVVSEGSRHAGTENTGRLKEPDLHLRTSDGYEVNDSTDSDPWHLAAGRGEVSAIEQIRNRSVHNAQSSPCCLDIANLPAQDDEVYTYTIPPRSTFLLSTIAPKTTSVLTHSALNLLPDLSQSAGPGQFDFILLDPPWSNRSVRRSRKYSTMDSYGGTQPQGLEPLNALEGMLGQHIAPGGFVGCWITNKPAVRMVALGLFEKWGVELVEEWVWLKVTSKGEPVTELGGVWRKPYEVLLLGRKRPAAEHRRYEEVEKNVGRRLIVAVPDLHSRKPSLRELIEPMMPDPKRYRALEIFARNLTAGWWAWGDECLKYNWVWYWSNSE